MERYELNERLDVHSLKDLLESDGTLRVFRISLPAIVNGVFQKGFIEYEGQREDVEATVEAALARKAIEAEEMEWRADFTSTLLKTLSYEDLRRLQRALTQKEDLAEEES